MLQSHLSIEPISILFNDAIDANVLILTISSLAGNTNWSFVGGSFPNKIINFTTSLGLSGTSTASSGTPPSNVTSISLSSVGNHTGSLASFNGYPDSGTSPAYPQKLVLNSAGAHTHVLSGGSELTNCYPPYMNIGAYKANGAVYTLPANTIVFMDNQPSPDLLLISTKSANYEDKHLRISSTEGAINTSGGSTSITSTYTSTSAGTHGHDTYTTNGNYTTLAGTRSNFQNAGAHTHSATLTFSLSTYGIKLRTWITTNSTKLAPGMMMLLNSSSVVPTNWSLCDGTVVTGASGRTYVTPNLMSSLYLKTTSTTAHLATSGSSNQLASSNNTLGSTSWSHSHGASTTGTGYIRSMYHGTFDAAHTHTFTAPSGSYNPPDVLFPMIMYTP